MKKFTLWLNSAKNTDYIGKCFIQKLYRIKFIKKKNSLNTYYISIYPRSGARQFQKHLYFWNIIMHWSGNVLKIFFRMHRITNYSKNFTFLQNFSMVYWKLLQNFSVFQNFTKNFRIRTYFCTPCLSFPKIFHNW